MTRRALLLAALLTLTVLAGCASKTPAPGGPEPAPATAPNVGGSDKVVTSVFPGEYDFTGPMSNVLTPGTLGIQEPQRVEIDSPQGGSIEMGLFLPDTAEKVPVLLFSSPYIDAEESVTRGGPAGQDTAPTVVNPSGAVQNLIDNFVPHGYAVVTHSVRGTGGSDGCNDLMGPGEMADIDAALTWLGTQDWSNGNIAMTGVSYDGSTPWTAAATGNPHLKTIFPISGVPDLYGLMYRNGSSEARGPLLLNALYIQGGLDSGEPTAAPGRLCPEAVEGLALSGTAGVLGTDPTGYWQARNRKPLVEQNYKGSVFSIQGLQDWNVDPSQVIPWVEQLEAKGLVTRQLVGQWEHSWPDSIGADGAGLDCPGGNPLVKACNRADWKEIMLRWMEHELKGKTDIDVGAPVQVADHLGRWRNEEHYPPHDLKWTTYHLDSGLLAPAAGPRASAVLYPQVAPGIPPNPPANVDLAVKGAARFVLGPVDEDLLIVGLPKVHVTVTPSGPGGYIGAYLYDLDSGTQGGSDCGPGTRIGWTTMNLAFADGGTERHEVMPGQTIQAMMEIQPMDAVVQKGHQLALCVWVYTEGDGQGAQARIPTLPPGPVTLEMGGTVESVLMLPTVQRDPSVYFQPPTPK
ncbi:MAG TPA: CocE/NonD family hydrolase [Candidatus Thermoplasmatota archaeon]|nr:CocE/NonD family hydrolase [Candidatus Thermoplasmatota archaeon]